MNVEDFEATLKRADIKEFSEEILSRRSNWFFDESDEIDKTVNYSTFRQVVSDHLGLTHDQVYLVGSSVYGFSMSPKKEKTFKSFHEDSDLDLAIVSPELFNSIWAELREAYFRGYTWTMRRHANEIFRRFSLLINGGDYDTALLRERRKHLDGIARKVYLHTGSVRVLKYRIYENFDAANEYHASGLAKIKRRLERDS